MIAPYRQHRRGVALLMTLAALVLVITVAAGIARLSVRAAMHQELQRHASLADDLLHAAEAPILHWLSTEAATVVLAADAQTPEVAVMHEQWTAGDLQFQLQVTAWDQQGMAPIRLVHRGSPLRGAVPQHVLDIVDRAEIGDDDDILGLDVLEESAAMDSCPLWPLPSLAHVKSIIIEPDGTYSVEEVDPNSAGRLPQKFGALVATHHEPAAIINVNTAPIGLIEQAMRIAGRGGIEQIIASRSMGERASAPTLQVTDHEDAPQLVISSTCWSFRIDIRVGRANRSWWSVYQLGERGWTCAQRLAMTR